MHPGSPRKHLRVAHAGLEVTGLDHSHLYPKVGELPSQGQEAEGQGIQSLRRQTKNNKISTQIGVE